MTTPSLLSDKNDWFANWFDTPYYHILYKNRSVEEAEDFITKLTNFLALPHQATLLDNACGQGRHAIYLNKLGYNVIGLDLSEQSIIQAQKFENTTLHFAVHDMREIYKENEFDAVFNLFTSFGYFEDESDDLNILYAVKKQLKDGGVFVLDFFNTHPIINKFANGYIYKDTQEIEGILFNIHKKAMGNIIIKNIDIVDGGKEFHYTEQVRLYTLQNFMEMFAKAGFIVKQVFGNYQLEAYNENESDRMIFVVSKGDNVIARNEAISSK